MAEEWEWEGDSMSSGYEDEEEEDISPPGSLSTPLKKAFSRYQLLLLLFAAGI